MSRIPAPPPEGRTVGAAAAQANVHAELPGGHTLPAGHRVSEFEVQGCVGEGGFGIVYLAFDHLLQRRVALKEFMPSSIALRSPGGAAVRVKAPRHQEAFEAGLRSFVNEARLLAQFDHPALVKVHRFWEANGTAYMVMPYYEGPTLKRALAERAEPPDERTLRAWLAPLLDALTLLHGARCLHRDIAPDNILLTAGGPLLLDFGAARRVIGDLTHALTVVLKPCYAPIEQYGAAPEEMPQGPWTDLYALASVVHYAITGKPPMPSVDRLLADRLVPLSQRAAGRYSAGFLHAIDAALALKPRDRPQSVAALRVLLDAEPPREATQAAVETVAVLARASAAPVEAPVPAHQRTLRLALPAAAAAALGIAALAAWWWTSPSAPTPARSTMTVTQRGAPVIVAPAPVADAPSATVPAVLEAGTAGAAGTRPAAVGLAPEADTRAAADDLPTAPVAPAAPGATRATDAAPAHAAAPVPAAPRRAAARAEPRPPAPPRERPARCTEILQKASLEGLSGEEAAFLRKECQ